MNLRNIATNVAKLTVVALLLGWMVQSGKLSMSQMAGVMGRKDTIAASILVWVLGPVLLGTWRWLLLIRGAGLHCPYLRAVKLQLVGFFFNTAMPGAVGGDIVKAIYIVRDQNVPSGKTPALLTVLLDRVVGLIGLFVMGIVAAACSFQQLVKNPVTENLMAGLAVVVALSAVFLGMVFISYKNDQDPVARLISKEWPGFAILKGIYDTLRGYRKHPRILFLTIGISVVIQLIFMMYMGFIGRLLYGAQAFDVNLLAPIFPFGVLATAIPLAPGGLGVGHAAFDSLFALVGLPGGANVFNVFAVSQLLLNLLGVIPYLSLRSKVA